LLTTSVVYPDMNTTLSVGLTSIRRRASSIPDISGITTSERTTSSGPECSLQTVIACAGECAVTTSYPFLERILEVKSKTMSLSSTTRTEPFVVGRSAGSGGVGVVLASVIGTAGR
jgi:hypothetical protein